MRVWKQTFSATFIAQILLKINNSNTRATPMDLYLNKYFPTGLQRNFATIFGKCIFTNDVMLPEQEAPRLQKFAVSTITQP